jgi:hypothetical protein
VANLLGENKNKYMLNSNNNAAFGTSSDDQDLNEDEESLEEDLKEELEELGEPAFAGVATDEDEEEAESVVDENNDELPFVPLEATTEDKEDDSENIPPIFRSIVANTLAPDKEEDGEEVGEQVEAEALSTKAATDEDEESAFDEISEDEEDEESLEEEPVNDDNVIISKAKIILISKLLRNIRENTDHLSSLIGGIDSEGFTEEQAGIAEIGGQFDSGEEDSDSVIEGVFNGENMIGPDGHEYAVPANYASKSKLVEGDMLKLTITDRGTFRYKQTKPIERKRVIGKLEKDAEGNYLVKADHKKFRVITASITYYKGIPGDKVVILIPVAGDSAWAAVENVIKS